MNKQDNIIVGTVHLHIGNGGINISVVDDPRNGATISIDSSQLGNNVITQRILTDPDTIKALAKMFTVASEHEYSGNPYWHAALSNNDNRENCGSRSSSADSVKTA